MTSEAEGSRGFREVEFVGEREPGLWTIQVLELLAAKARPLGHAGSLPLRREAASDPCLTARLALG